MAVPDAERGEVAKALVHRKRARRSIAMRLKRSCAAG
ncbi:MAG: hypothetical protein ACLSVD_08165 [Eggerthellaceae bacterium]